MFATEGFTLAAASIYLQTNCVLLPPSNTKNTTKTRIDISTSPFKQKDPEHSAYLTIELNTPSRDTAHITEVACTIVRHIYRPGYRYTKAGVILMNLQANSTEQLSLDLGEEDPATRQRLIQALDSINERYERGTLHLASSGTAGKHRVWEMKQERKTPSYTTNWTSLLVAS